MAISQTETLVKKTESDQAFMARIVGGDQEAVEGFVAKYLPIFMQITRRAQVPARDREDVAQGICLMALGQMQRGIFRGESQFATWLIGIAKGKIAEYWQARSVSSLNNLPNDLEERGAVLDSAITGATDVAESEELMLAEITGDLDMRLAPPPRKMRKIKVKLKFAGRAAPRIPFDLESEWTR